MKLFTSRSCQAAAAAVVAALLLSACSSDSGGDTRGASLKQRVPDAIRAAGVIRVGASYTAAPVIFQGTDGKAAGLDADLAAALGNQLGVRLEFQNVGSFSAVLPGLLEKKYDIGMSGITDTGDRQQGLDQDGALVNNGVDFVDYFMAGTGMVVRKGNPGKIAVIDDLCGRTVSVKKGTIHYELTARQQKACGYLGKPLKLLEASTDAESLEHLSSGSADVYVTDYPKAQYNAQTVDGGRAFEVAGPQIQSRPYGIAVRKTDSALRDVLVKAMNAIIQDGSYDKVLADHQLSAGVIQYSVVNGGR
ncbi:transporter substrate-binding domain-containing protein (plasmid) [Kitasatospora sp. NBC_00070]|uniref:transporter substrate-binding domain-containing protein n=1 Tax=Kitasatospora sp. NBC_00070 TaxID=2975962 RepID=UPI002F919C6D